MSVEKLIVDHMETWTSALQTCSTARRGSSGKIDLYGIKKLRELILEELAVRGKLVPQDPNDEPASELLEAYCGGKAELVKQVKLKAKPLPEIRRKRNRFELPEGWEWSHWQPWVK